MSDDDTDRPPLPDDRREAPRKTDLEGTEHGFSKAGYRLCTHSKLAEEEILPTLECLCGMWWAGDTWEDAGCYFDDHLEDVSDGPA